MIEQGRERYNAYRVEAGLPEVSDWRQRPEQLMQRLPSRSEGAILTSNPNILYSMADMRKLPKTSDRGFAESVATLRRKDESPYIVQETKTSDDINKIAKEVLKDVAANPERYADEIQLIQNGQQLYF